MKMPMLTLYQPYASAFPYGVKEMETRGWKTDYRGPVALHAAARMPKECRDLAYYAYGRGWMPEPDDLPLGCVVAIATLHEIHATESTYVEVTVKGMERQFGDYSPGRYAWDFLNVKKLMTPYRIKGHQGLRSVEIPDAIVLDAVPIDRQALAMQRLSLVPKTDLF